MLDPSPDPPEPAPDPQASEPAVRERLPWGSILRTVGLVVAALVMVWLVFNVQLPGRDAMRADIESFGAWGWLVFVGAYAAIALTPIPVSVMAITAGVLYGTFAGSILSVIGAMIGSIGAYWLAHGLGRNTALWLLGSRRTTLEERLDSAGFEAVFTLRVLPGMPYWPVNYGGGAFGVPFRMFTIACAVASIPGQVSLVAIGAFAAQPSISTGTTVVVAWTVVILMTIWAWRAWRGISRWPLPGAKKDA